MKHGEFVRNFVGRHPFISLMALSTVVGGVKDCVRYITGYGKNDVDVANAVRTAGEAIGDAVKVYAETETSKPADSEGLKIVEPEEETSEEATETCRMGFHYTE